MVFSFKKDVDARRRVVLASRRILKQWRSDWRSHLIAGAAGVFLGLAGAFGTQNTPLLPRLGFWALMMFTGSFCASVITIITSQRPQFRQHWLLRWAMPTLLIALFMSFFSWALSNALFGGGASSNFLVFVWISVIVSGSMTALMMLINTPGPATEGAPEGTAITLIHFRSRLPQELKGAVIYAIKAEDHYLNIYSSKGSALILSKLSDAILELDGIEGAQVHRSWWVAREAVAKVRRTRNRVQLELINGVVAPVSRPNVRALRESGWF